MEGWTVLVDDFEERLMGRYLSLLPLIQMTL